MTCQSCTEAESNPLTPSFHAGCKECAARALAGGPQFWQASKAKDIAAGGYRDALQSIFGDGWQQWHTKVRGWADRIAAAQRGDAP